MTEARSNKYLNILGTIFCGPESESEKCFCMCVVVVFCLRLIWAGTLDWAIDEFQGFEATLFVDIFYVTDFTQYLSSWLFGGSAIHLFSMLLWEELADKLYNP